MLQVIRTIRTVLLNDGVLVPLAHKALSLRKI